MLFHSIHVPIGDELLQDDQYIHKFLQQFYDFVQYVYVWTIDSVIRGLDFQHDGLIHLC